jgi:quercetin dioxygenase-like cupin family protein
VWFVADTMIYKATAENTGGSFAVIECITTPGGGPPPHIHTNEDEFWTVLDGTFEITIGGATHAAGPGDFAFGLRGIAHSFRNTADTPSQILLGFTPGGIEGFLRESGQPATNNGPAPAIDDAEIARMMLAAPKYGIVLIGPDA